MAKSLFTKKFHFSASYEKNGKFYGHNYALTLAIDGIPSEEEEFRLVETVERALIRKVHSHDFGLHVDFLKNVEITPENLLNAFWNKLEPLVRPYRLESISLARDERTTFSRAKC